MTPLLIALAGAMGVLARYTVGLVTASIWATLAVNVLGSLLLGALTHLGRDLPPVALQALGVGFLGGFTTFSTFSLQALLTAEGGRPLTAALYVVASVALGLGAAAAGYAASRALSP